MSSNQYRAFVGNVADVFRCIHEKLLAYFRVKSVCGRGRVRVRVGTENNIGEAIRTNFDY